MARTKRTHRRAGFTLPIAVVAGFVPLVTDIVNTVKSGGWQSVGDVIVGDFIGYHPTTGQWNFADVKDGLVPIGLGILVHKFVGGMLGVNRYLGRARIPIIRI